MLAARHLDLDAILAMAAPLDAATLGSRARAEAARPADRARLGWGVLLRLSACARRLAARPARRSCRSRRCATKRRHRTAMSAGCPAAIPSCMPARSRRRSASSTVCAAFSQSHPVHGECGGYMVLGEGLEDADGARHAMAGLLGHATSFAKRRLHLGYRQARLPLGQPDRCRWRCRARPRISSRLDHRQRHRRAVCGSDRCARQRRSPRPAAAADLCQALFFTPLRGRRDRTGRACGVQDRQSGHQPAGGWIGRK